MVTKVFAHCDELYTWSTSGVFQNGCALMLLKRLTAKINRMKKRSVRRFIFRTLLCFLLIGGAVFALTYKNFIETPVSPAQQTTVLLAGQLSENYLRGNSLATFNQSDPQTAEALTRLVKELENNTADLEQTASVAELSNEQKTSLKAIIAMQRDAIAKFRLANSVLAKAISYDPIEDLTLLDPTSQRTEILSRANAAAVGLERIVTTPADTAAGQLGVGTVDGPQSLVSEAVRQAISDQVSCLRNLAQQTGASAVQIKSSVQRCTDSYPTLRKLAVENVLSLSFNKSYTDKLDEETLPLLKQLKEPTS